MFARIAAWWKVALGVVAGAVIALGTFITNADKILSFFHINIAQIVAGDTEISIRVDDPGHLAANIGDITLGFANEKNETVKQLVIAGASGKASVPSGSRYKVIWQGPGIDPAHAEDLLTPERTLNVVLIAKKGQTGVAFDLRVGSKDLATSPPTAALLLAPAPTASTEATTFRSAVPQFDRAAAVVGLFETGTTDCAHQIDVSIWPPLVGCLSISSPGLVTSLVAELDRGVPGAVSAVGNDAATLRRLAAANPYAIGPLWPADIDKAAVRRRLLGLPDVWIAYENQALALYQQALQEAHNFDLRSERGTLLVFDRMIQTGVASVRAVRAAFDQQVKQAKTPPTEPDRIALVAKLLQEGVRPSPAIPTVQVLTRQRIQLIATGVGTFHGIEFDLDKLGITTAPVP
jgi:hypothetical protein